MNLGPLPLEADRRYQWRLSVDGRQDEDWTLAFATRQAAPAGPPREAQE